MQVALNLMRNSRGRIVRSALTFLTCWIAYGQTRNPSPVFDVASIKQSPPVRGPRLGGCKGGPGSPDPGLFTCVKTNIANLLIYAFQLEEYQLPSADFGDPVTYEVTAKAPEGTTKEQFRLMLQNLLIERFKLAYHFEKRERQVYELVVAKGGLKMKESPQSPAGRDGPSSLPRSGAPAVDADGYPIVARPLTPGRIAQAIVNGLARWNANSVEIDQITSMVSSSIGAPVANRTGLTGSYDFILSWAPQTNPTNDPLGPTLVEAVEKQLGLKLERKKGSIDAFVIDQLQRVAIQN
jgi:uncharacterized protein (TIGR03435 family)